MYRAARAAKNHIKNLCSTVLNFIPHFLCIVGIWNYLFIFFLLHTDTRTRWERWCCQLLLFPSSFYRLTSAVAQDNKERVLSTWLNVNGKELKQIRKPSKIGVSRPWLVQGDGRGGIFAWPKLTLCCVALSFSYYQSIRFDKTVFPFLESPTYKKRPKASRLSKSVQKGPNCPKVSKFFKRVQSVPNVQKSPTMCKVSKYVQKCSKASKVSQSVPKWPEAFKSVQHMQNCLKESKLSKAY